MNSKDQNQINDNNSNVHNKINESQFSFNANQHTFPINNQSSFKIYPKSSCENNETTNVFSGQE